MRAMFMLKGSKSSLVHEGEVKVVEQVERTVPVREGDEVVCLVVGTAHVYAGGREIEIQNPRFEKVLEVRKQRPK